MLNLSKLYIMHRLVLYVSRLVRIFCYDAIFMYNSYSVEWRTKVGKENVDHLVSIYCFEAFGILLNDCYNNKPNLLKVIHIYMYIELR